MKKIGDSSVFYASVTLPDIYTTLLKRNVTVELMLPEDYKTSGKRYPLLILNDGQDNQAVDLLKILRKLGRENQIREIVVAGVYAGDRLQEFGVSSKPDFKKRGKRAKLYAKFLIDELIPYLVYKYPVSEKSTEHVIAGYSMGGLSAIDIAWNHPEVFVKAGAFSGSFWWRKRDTKSRFYSDQRDRLMHQQIKKGKFKPGLKFWFQTGTNDERSDRNKNGVIDSIDDTLDLITELTKKGYRPFHDVHYVETTGGEHNHNTWKKVMPDFLKWAFPK